MPEEPEPAPEQLAAARLMEGPEELRPDRERGQP
jgi:hypothetical protein